MLRAGWNGGGESHCRTNWENRGYETCGLVIWGFILFSSLSPVLSLGSRWVKSGTGYVGQWGRRLPESAGSFQLGSLAPSPPPFFPLICPPCVVLACVFQPQGPPCEPAPLSFFPIFLGWRWLVFLIMFEEKDFTCFIQLLLLLGKYHIHQIRY